MGDGSLDVGERLDRIENKLDKSLEKDQNLSVRVNTLETQYKFWIGIATFIGALVSQLISFLFKYWTK